MNPTDSLRAAVSRLNRAVSARDKISAAIDAIAIPQEASSQREIADLRLAYETAAAEVALGSATKEQIDIARTNLEEASRRRDAAERAVAESAAIRAGLERKLSAADVEVVEASEQVRTFEVDYLKAELIAADKIYVTSALEVEAALQRIEACRRALGERKVHGFIGAGQIAQPTLPVAGPFSEAHVRAVHSLGATGSLAWRSLVAPWNLSVLDAAMKAELEGAAQDHGLIGRVRKAIAGVID